MDRTRLSPTLGLRRLPYPRPPIPLCGIGLYFCSVPESKLELRWSVVPLSISFVKFASLLYTAQKIAPHVPCEALWIVLDSNQ